MNIVEIDSFNEMLDDYKKLWEKSSQSPFLAPKYILSLSEYYKRSFDLKHFLIKEDLNIIAAGSFKMHKNSWMFLTHNDSDFDGITYDTSVEKNKIKDVLSLIFDSLNERVIFNKISQEDAVFKELNLLCLPDKKLFIFPYTVCPILRCNNGEMIFPHFNNKKIRYYENRLNKKGDCGFFVYEELEDMDNWIMHFVNMHKKLWDGKRRPNSKFHDTKIISKLRSDLTAWAKDEVLVRYGLKLDGEYISMVIGLKSGKSIIYHSIAYNPDYAKYSPGIATLRFIGRWMDANKYHELDFGIGNESYKYSFSNFESQLYKIIIVNRNDYIGLLISFVERFVRKRPFLLKLYRLIKKRINI